MGAQKVGGMKVVTKPRSSESEKPVDKTKTEEGEEEEVEEGEKEDKEKVVVSGAKTGEEDAFPTEAVKAYHEKPRPTHEKNTITSSSIGSSSQGSSRHFVSSSLIVPGAFAYCTIVVKH